MHFDSKSITSIFILKNGLKINLNTLNIALDLNFNNENHINLKGELIGILKTFSGGNLSLKLSPKDFFSLDMKIFEEKITFYLSYVSQGKTSFITDRIYTVLKTQSFGTTENHLTYNLNFNIIDGIYRSKNGENFKLMYKMHESYFIKTQEDSTKLKLVYGEEETIIDLPYVTDFSYSNRIRSDYAKLLNENAWAFTHEGVETGILKIKAKIYDILDEINTKKNINKKEDVLNTFYRLLESTEKNANKKLELPYEIFIESSLIENIRPIEWSFFLTDVEARYIKNSVEVNLTFIEKRTQVKNFKQKNLSKSKQNINKKEEVNTFASRSLNNGELPNIEDEARILKKINSFN